MYFELFWSFVAKRCEDEQQKQSTDIRIPGNYNIFHGKLVKQSGSELNFF